MPGCGAEEDTWPRNRRCLISLQLHGHQGGFVFCSVLLLSIFRLVRIYHHACNESVLSWFHRKRLCHFFLFLLPNFYLFFTDYCAHFESIIKCSWHEDNITLNFICWLGGRWDKHNIKYLSNCLYPASRAAAGRGLEHLLVIELTEIALGVERWQHQPQFYEVQCWEAAGRRGEVSTN